MKDINFCVAIYVVAFEFRFKELCNNYKIMEITVKTPWHKTTKSTILDAQPIMSTNVHGMKCAIFGNIINLIFFSYFD